MPRIRRGYPVIRPGTARLHPKGTSSRFARRAPRRLAPHNDKSGVITVLTGACTSRQRCAGSGMPLPYNSGCGRRNCFKICNCQRLRSERRYRRNWLVRFCRQPVRIASACRIPIADTAACAATHEKQTKLRKIPLFFLLWRAIMNLQNRSTLFLRPIIVDNVKGAYL